MRKVHTECSLNISSVAWQQEHNAHSHTHVAAQQSHDVNDCLPETDMCRKEESKGERLHQEFLAIVLLFL